VTTDNQPAARGWTIALFEGEGQGHEVPETRRPLPLTDTGAVMEWNTLPRADRLWCWVLVDGEPHCGWPVSEYAVAEGRYVIHIGDEAR